MYQYIKSHNREIVWLVILLASAAAVRFYNFADRITFGPEQADSLIVAAENISHKWSLLGQSYFARTTSTGHLIYASPLFSYSLVPLLWLFQFSPYGITVYYGFLNLVTGVVLYWWTRKQWGVRFAWIASFLFLFNAYMIKHSMFIWILNYLPLIGLVSSALLFKFYKKPNWTVVWWLGILSGIGVGLEYMYLAWAGTVWLLLVWKSKNKIRDTGIYTAGGLVANAPLVIFELKHNFYNLRTLWQYVLDTWANPGQNAVSDYHFFPLWPMAAIVCAWLITKRLSHPLATTGVLVIYLLLNLMTKQVSFTKPTGMSDGWSWPQLAQTAQVIAQDQPRKFQVASLVSSDTVRAYPLRYLLRYRYQLTPLNVDDYPSANAQYIVALETEDLENSAVWEVAALKPFSYIKLTNFKSGYELFKLNKEI